MVTIPTWPTSIAALTMMPMTILVTGSAGHLGEALMRALRERNVPALGLDRLPSPYTDIVGSLVDRDLVTRAMRDVDAVVHTATLHKPHVETHSRQAFVDTNVTGTLNLLEASSRVRAFVFTSTTSTFGDALTPPPGNPAAWITEDVVPVPKNIYGVTKVAAEDLCQLFHRNAGLSCVILRTSRFFPEEDDSAEKRDSYDNANLKVNELLYRRADIEDMVGAHLVALEKAQKIGFGRFIVSATTPFTRDDLAELAVDAPAVLRRRVPEYADEYARRGWKMLPTLDRVYVNQRAREALDWTPRHDFRSALRRLRQGEDWQSPLAIAIGRKGYHRSLTP